MPLRRLTDPTVAPWNSAGTVTSTFMTGSSTTGAAASHAARNAYVAAILNASSELSTA